MERTIKEHLLRIRDLLKKENYAQKISGKRIYAVIKKMFKAEKIFVTTVQRVSLKIFCRAFC